MSVRYYSVVPGRNTGLALLSWILSTIRIAYWLRIKYLITLSVVTGLRGLVISTIRVRNS